MNQNIKCRFNNCTETDETRLELHHIVPRYFFPEDLKKKCDLIIINNQEESNRIYLCKKHHGQIHSAITKIIWNTLTENQQEEIRRKVYDLTTQQWCKK